MEDGTEERKERDGGKGWEGGRKRRENKWMDEGRERKRERQRVRNRYWDSFLFNGYIVLCIF